MFVGFCGVVVALHPAAGPLSLGTLYALLRSFLYAGFLIATGRLPTIPASVRMAQQLFATVLFDARFVLFQGWTTPPPVDAVLMLMLGFGSLDGNLRVNLALRFGPAVLFVPFQYTMLLWGILLGFLVFGICRERPACPLPRLSLSRGCSSCCGSIGSSRPKRCQ